jgi:hypothetical protein
MRHRSTRLAEVKLDDFIALTFSVVGDLNAYRNLASCING